MTLTLIEQPDVLSVPTLQVYRCWQCNKIIFKGLLPAGTIVEYKCRCHAMTVLTVAKDQTAS